MSTSCTLHDAVDYFLGHGPLMTEELRRRCKGFMMRDIGRSELGAVLSEMIRSKQIRCTAKGHSRLYSRGSK